MTEALRIEGLHKRFGDREVLKGIDLSVQRGQAVAILGASGSGKSTLLRCVNMMEIPTAGRVLLNGQVVGRERGGRVDYPERALAPFRARVGMVFQQFNLFPHMTAAQNVMEGPRTVLRLGRAECERRAARYLAKVGLGDRGDAWPSQLSGGQQQRVAIARALAMEPEIMLFDEATSALDPELVGEVLDTIGELAAEGMTMLIVTHELGFAHAVADHVVFLHDGRVLEQGPPGEVLRRPGAEALRAFLRGHGRFRMPEPEFD